MVSSRHACTLVSEIQNERLSVSVTRRVWKNYKVIISFLTQWFLVQGISFHYNQGAIVFLKRDSWPANSLKIQNASCFSIALLFVHRLAKFYVLLQFYCSLTIFGFDQQNPVSMRNLRCWCSSRRNFTIYCGTLLYVWFELKKIISFSIIHVFFSGGCQYQNQRFCSCFLV